MRRIHIFLYILAASLSLFVILFGVSLYWATTAPSSYHSGWTHNMWNGMGMDGMMGDTGYNGTVMPSYLWLIPAGLIGVAAISVIGLVFYFAFPEILPATTLNKAGETETVARNPPKDPPAEAVSPIALRGPYESVSKTLTPEERKVLDVLVAHQGKYLQKYIRKEAGLSRLKTHRIIARFAERGMVTLQQSGNTNEVVIADWLRQSPPSMPKNV